MTFKQWVKTYLGKKTDFDGAYGVQCVDLAKCYIEKVLGIKAKSIGDAKDYWEKRSTEEYLKDNFTPIKCTYKNGELKTGDIGVRTSGKHGHIFIVAEPTKNGKIKFYDQNAYGKGDGMTLRTKAYTHMVITGVLRPKNQKNISKPKPSKTESKPKPTKTENKPKPTKTENKPKPAKKKKTEYYKAGGTYTLLTDVKVRKGPSMIYSQKHRSELTTDGKKNSKASLFAVLKKGTKVTASKVEKDPSDNIWLYIPSGWVCAYLSKDKETLIK